MWSMDLFISKPNDVAHSVGVNFGNVKKVIFFHKVMMCFTKHNIQINFKLNNFKLIFFHI